MDDLFLNYMEQRFQKEIKPLSKPRKKRIGNGPVITISRQSGCSGNDFAEELQKAIHQYYKKQAIKQNWDRINKEILEESAKELGLEPKKIKYVFDSEKRTTMNEVMESMFAKYYKNDRVIRKTIINVIKDYAAIGNKIIVGRAGVAIAHNMQNSFHIRLVAPLRWRADNIATRYDISYEEALLYNQEMDQKRMLLIEEFYGKNMHDSMFDIVFNVSSISTKDAIKSCLPILKTKEII